MTENKTKNKQFVVATINFFDNEIKQTIQFATDELSAFKLHMVSLCKSENTDDELKWQSDAMYPKNYTELLDVITDWEMDVSVIEIQTN